MEDVHIANPPGAQTHDLLLAGHIEAHLALAPLIRGQVRIEQIDIDQPLFGLERLAAGGATWELHPKLEVTDYVSAEHIAVNGITISRGTMVVGDGRRGGLAQLDDVNAQLSAPALDGPWRFNGKASYHGQPVDVSLTTGKYHADEPLRVGMRLNPADGSGIIYTFDGEVGGARADVISGNLKLKPARPVDGKGDRETGLKPLVFSSAVKVRNDTVTFDKIELYPAHALDAANLLTGKAVVRLGSAIVVDADLKAAKLDVDAVTGKRGRALVYSPSSLDLLAAAQELLPEKLTANVRLGIKSLVVAGSSLDGASLDATISRRQLVFRRLEVQLPGQTRFGFSGAFVAGASGPQLIGDIDLDSLAIRDLVEWAAPSSARDIARVWSGSRGQLNFKARADVSATALRLSDIAGELDGDKIGGSVRLAGGDAPSVAVRFDADRLDIDRYAPDGFTMVSEEANPVLAGIDIVARSMGLGDFRLTANAGRLKLNGVEAEDVAIDMGANENGIEFRTVDVGNVAGARLDMTGLLQFPKQAVAGSINAKVTASDPQGLFRLLGLAGRGDTATIYDRLAALKPLNLDVVGQATSEDDNTTGNLKVKGVFGKTDLSINASFDGKAGKWKDGEVHVSAEAKDPSSAAVLALSGFDSKASEDAAARLAFTSTGSYARGLATTFDASAYGGRIQFVGTLGEGHAGPRLNGRLALLAERADQVYRALGVPAGELSPMAQVLSGEGGLSAEDGKVRIDDLNGTLAGISYTGRVSADLSGEVPAVTARLDLGRVSAPWILNAIMLPHDGKPHDFTTPFPEDFGVPAGIDAKLTVEALELMPGLALNPATLDVTASGKKVTVKAEGSANGRDPVSLALAAEPGKTGVKMTGEIAGRLPLETIFQRSDGAHVISGPGDIALSFAGEGRSPQGLATAAKANGTYKLASGVLNNISPSTFSRDLESATTPEDVDRLLRNSLSAGDMAFTGGEGTLSLEKGLLTASPLAVTGSDAKGQLRVLFEPAEGKADIAIDLNLARPEGVPAFEIAYAGHPFALQRSTDTQALKNFLVVKVLNESLKKLEELQMREKQMRQEEEQFKREQEIRDRTRKEVQRRLNEMKAGTRAPRTRAPMRSPRPISSNAQVDAALVPVPKKKPPVPEDFSALPAQQPAVAPPPPPPALRRNVAAAIPVQRAGRAHPANATECAAELPFGKR